MRGSVYEPVELDDDSDDVDVLEGVEIRLGSRLGSSVHFTEESDSPILTSSSMRFMFDSRSSPEDVGEDAEDGSDSEQFFSGSASSSGSDLETGAEDGGVMERAYVSHISSAPFR